MIAMASEKHAPAHRTEQDGEKTHRKKKSAPSRYRKGRPRAFDYRSTSIRAPHRNPPANGRMRYPLSFNSPFSERDPSFRASPYLHL
ncbi:hypothetical protein CDAR_511121 [Caerostris darwini]|uniref:Uncharacterized protein n=1 Tax=Caerostris darwini TaxID=1538125 RepID=A0AAV4S6P1_9ARAC|nr:hypothetical protein CDAR_511121 [Caerostris darwini]